MEGANTASSGDQDPGLVCLALVLGFHQIAADPDQLKHALGVEGAATPSDLVRLAKRLGTRAKLARVRIERLDRAPTPFIGRDGQGRWFILGGVRDGAALVQRVGTAPEMIPIEQLARTWDGEAVFVTTRAGIGFGPEAFDVSWFIPALWRYKHLLRDVLIASLVLQLLALATPLFFQVVIDRVLVHQSLTTLHVLAIGLGAVIAFETVLGGMRAWLFTHTTSRVDVELGAKLYRHVLSLPLAYFENRRVGDTVARVRELETVREFLTSSAVTLIIDLAFTIIFLVIMWFYSPAFDLPPEFRTKTCLKVGLL
ncbi:MAG: ABC transporter transmembrane domain-containing protein, partial [Caulobacterales bacterium]